MEFVGTGAEAIPLGDATPRVAGVCALPVLLLLGSCPTTTLAGFALWYGPANCPSSEPRFRMLKAKRVEEILEKMRRKVFPAQVKAVTLSRVLASMTNL